MEIGAEIDRECAQAARHIAAQKLGYRSQAKGAVRFLGEYTDARQRAEQAIQRAVVGAAGSRQIIDLSWTVFQQVRDAQFGRGSNGLCRYKAKNHLGELC